MTTDLLIIIVGLAALVWSADRFIEGAAAIARRAGMSPLVIGMTIVSVGTSAPEILVSLMSALADSGGLAVGNALGSNIANIGLVMGVTLLISPVAVGRATTFTDLPILLTTVLVCGFLLRDGKLDIWDAYILLAGLILFLGRVAQHARKPDINDETPEIPDLSVLTAWFYFLVGLIVLVGSSRALVYASVNIATLLGVSDLIIGLTIVAIGTSLPELAAATVSAVRGHADIAIGAVVGSNMFNLLIVLALPGLFGEVTLGMAALYRDVGTVLLTTVALAVFTWATWNPEKQCAQLGKGAGTLLLLTYVLYYVWLFMTSHG